MNQNLDPFLNIPGTTGHIHKFLLFETFQTSGRLLDKFVLGLILLFPLFGNLIGSWFSSIFFLLAISSLFYIKAGWQLIDSYQKLVAYSLIAFFAVFLLNACLLGWGNPEVKSLSIELRFIFIIPLMCMGAVIPEARKALLIGLAGSLIVMLGQAVVEVLLLSSDRLVGINNPLRVAAMALVAMALVAPWLWLQRYYRSSMFIILSGVMVLVAAQGRLAMVAAIIVTIGLSLILISNWKRRFFALLGIAAIVAVVASSQTIQGRYGEVKSLSQYIASDNHFAFNERPGSTIIHYMMLELSWLMLKEHPLLGVGSKRYAEHAQIYVDQGRVHPVLGDNDLATPHNMVAEIAVSKGFVGLFIAAIFLWAIGLLIYRRGRQGMPIAIFISCVLLTGITESWWVRTGSFVSILVLFIAILSAQRADTEERT